MPTVEDVRSYWNSKPLFSHEIHDVGSVEYFQQIDHIKKSDVERFSMGYWKFDRFSTKNVLDIGCGPGWVTVQYARGGANVTAVDLTDAAVDLTRRHVELLGLRATTQQANAETLPFGDNEFDLIVSSGVMHHTPDTQKTFDEAFRVLRPGGVGKITLYRLGILHSRLLFPFVKLGMRVLSMKHPGADMARTASSVEDFVRQYDGAENPIGIAKTNSEWAVDLRKAGFVVEGVENHFFPARFLPFVHWMPSATHRLLDGAFGTMVYFSLRKPVR